MAKKKELAEAIEIRFIKERDSLIKFQKILRKLLKDEKRNITIDMVYAPDMEPSYLSSLVFIARSLKTLGKTFTIIVSPSNYQALKKFEHASLFNFEIAQVISEDEISEMLTESKENEKNFLVEDGQIIVEDEGIEEIPNYLPGLIDKVLQNQEEVLVDLSRAYMLTPEAISSLAEQTVETGGKVYIKIQDFMKEVLQAHPHSSSLQVVEDTQQVPPKQLETQEFAFVDSTILEKSPVASDPSPEESESEANSESALDALPVDSEAEIGTVSEETSSSPAPSTDGNFEFQIRVNCLEVGDIREELFVDKFPEQLKKLFLYGNRLYVSLVHFRKLSAKAADRILEATIKARREKKKLVWQMTDKQAAKLAEFFPIIERTEIKEDATPRFEISGPCMELHNVDINLFLKEFPQRFQELLYAGHESITVDISRMKNFSPKAIDFVSLCYLDAVAENVKMSLRIRPDMEEAFLKSGRGRNIPLEIIRETPESQLANVGRRKTMGIDMSKIREAMQEDKLTKKVLDKKFDALHVEARGSVHNWENQGEPVEKKAQYRGPERRKDKRYPAPDVEAAFGRGSMAKISDRRYPVSNISARGCRFVSGIQLSRAESLRLKVFHPKIKDIEVTAKVIWCTPVPSRALFEVGVEFTKIGVLAKNQLQDLLRLVYKKSQQQEERK